jgi:hypothetical protein
MAASEDASPTAEFIFLKNIVLVGTLVGKAKVLWEVLALGFHGCC